MCVSWPAAVRSRGLHRWADGSGVQYSGGWWEFTTGTHTHKDNSNNSVSFLNPVFKMHSSSLYLSLLWRKVNRRDQRLHFSFSAWIWCYNKSSMFMTCLHVNSGCLYHLPASWCQHYICVVLLTSSSVSSVGRARHEFIGSSSRQENI